MQRKDLFLYLAIGLALIAYFVISPPRVSPSRLDFNAFYCGSKVLSSSIDPYKYEPLNLCENSHPPVADWGAVTPDPLPPFAIAAFIPLTWLDYARAAVVWWILLLICGAVVVYAVTRLTGLNWFVVAACTVPALLATPWRVGALAPLPIALICAAALCESNRRYVGAAILLGCSCMEPHIALPAIACALLLRPRLRIPLVVVGAIIAIASAFSGGIAMNVEYLTRVLPAHAASELGTRVQYSLTSVLSILGVPDRTAILAGTAQYCIFVVLGILVAYAFRRKMPSALLLAPVAFSVGGGEFVHDTQIAAAIPFALLLASQLQSIGSWFAVVLLAIPWLSISESISRYFSFFYFTQAVSPPSSPSALAEDGWKPFINQMSPTPLWALEHVPVYVGLLIVYLLSLRSAWLVAAGKAARPLAASKAIWSGLALAVLYVAARPHFGTAWYLESANLPNAPRNNVLVQARVLMFATPDSCAEALAQLGGGQSSGAHCAAKNSLLWGW